MAPFFVVVDEGEAVLLLPLLLLLEGVVELEVEFEVEFELEPENEGCKKGKIGISRQARALHTALRLLQCQGRCLVCGRAVCLETRCGCGLEGRVGAHTSNVGARKKERIREGGPVAEHEG